MKILPIIHCSACKCFLELTWEDIEVRAYGVAYFAHCGCRQTIRLNSDFAQRLLGDRPEEPEEVKAEPPPKVETETGDEKVRKAYMAFEAMQKHGSRAKAAEALGVSGPTVTNWMKYLPPMEVSGSEGDVPPA